MARKEQEKRHQRMFWIKQTYRPGEGRGGSVADTQSEEGKGEFHGNVEKNLKSSLLVEPLKFKCWQKPGRVARVIVGVQGAAVGCLWKV